VAVCSWQDAYDAITTPLRKDIRAARGPAYTVQYLSGTAWAGNGYNATLPIPESELATTETLIAIYQQRFLAALSQEPGYDPTDTGSTDALPPLAFAEMAGLCAARHPLAACKIEGIAADPSAILELLVKEKLMLDPKAGQEGIVPLALLHDPRKNIHYGYALIGAEREADLLTAREHVLERLAKAGLLTIN
jgi:hypothetical protein